MPTPSKIDKLLELRDLAESHGGRLLDEFYEKSTVPMTWECARGHQWQASSAAIKRKRWCSTCAKQDRRMAALEAAQDPMQETFVITHSHMCRHILTIDVTPAPDIVKDALCRGEDGHSFHVHDGQEIWDILMRMRPPPYDVVKWLRGVGGWFVPLEGVVPVPRFVASVVAHQLRVDQLPAADNPFEIAGAPEVRALK